ncbi:MAG: hypothetical protein HXK86_04500, partial [Lachnospiraceae bacterium]|nr:hypothetical protein [Lachnospiraceae bacterium]
MNWSTKKNWKQRVWSCRPNKKDIPLILRSLFLAGMIGRLFYDSWIAALLLLPVSILYYLHEKEEKKKAQLRELGIQFRDVITAMAANQKAGYAMENAVMEASKDIALLYG